METIHVKLVKSPPDDERLWFHLYIGREFIDHFPMAPPGKDWVPYVDDDRGIGQVIRMVLTQALSKVAT